MNTPIATRTLYLLDDQSKKYTIEMFAPVLQTNGIYLCEIRIDNAPEGLNQISIGGADSFQALILAIKTLQTMVETLNKKFLNSRLRWVDDNKEDLGFSIDNQ